MGRNQEKRLTGFFSGKHWGRNILLIIGLTGGIASGKSTVSSMFREHGVPVICADELAHEAVLPGSPALDEIRELFGDDVFDECGELDRLALGAKVFADHRLKKKLEDIVHPVVERGKNELLEKYSSQSHPMAVVDVPLLFEAGWNHEVDVIVVVYVGRDLQVSRLVQRNGLSEREAQARLDSQWSLDDKKKKAHLVIDNSGSMENTRTRFEQALETLKSMASSRA